LVLGNRSGDDPKKRNEPATAVYISTASAPDPFWFSLCVCVCHLPVLLLAIKREKRGKTGSAANGDEKQRG
jgi:hypothetical protein